MSGLLNWGQADTSMVDNIMADSFNAVPGLGNNELQFMSGMDLGGGSGGGMFSNFLGKDGWGGLALGGAQTLMNGWMGMKKLDLAKQQLAENKRQFDMNWGAQKNLTNNRLALAQQVRASANPNAQQVAEYMKQWGVK